MTKQELLQLFDDTKDNFKWFFDDYGYDWNKLLELRKAEDQDGMYSYMNTVWYELPDNQFNIMRNPKGWSDFLNLLEEYV
jgi:hypothetical protein